MVKGRKQPLPSRSCFPVSGFNLLNRNTSLFKKLREEATAGS
jgi:hypothetical protein